MVDRLLKNNRHALVETEQMLRDARLMGRYDEVGPHLERVLERERFIAALFGADDRFDADVIAWDVAMYFPAGTAWEDPFPTPTWSDAPVEQAVPRVIRALDAGKPTHGSRSPGLR